MIVSTQKGRMRVRFNKLRSASVAQRAKAEVEKQPGILSVRDNSAACSLIILFDDQKWKAEDLEDEIMDICIQAAKPIKKASSQNKSRTLSKRVNQATKVGMVGTLSASLAYGFMGKKKPHIYYGVAFVALAGAHMLRYSKTLFR